MEMIGKISGLPLFEFGEGQYVAVDVDDRRVIPMWSWYANLGRWFDLFEKCTFCENEMECVGIIEENLEEISERFQGFKDELESEDGKEFLEEQEKFYQWLESNRKYDWNDGYLDERDKE